MHPDLKFDQELWSRLQITPKEFTTYSEWEGGNQSGHFTQMSVNQGVCLGFCACVCVRRSKKQSVQMGVYFNSKHFDSNFQKQWLPPKQV